MKVRILYCLAFLFTLTAISCSESAKLDEFHDWQSRNDAYIDSVASYVHDNYESRGISKENAGEGDMFRILSYKLNPSQQWDCSDYVYCRIVRKGEGTVSPVSTSDVEIDYRCRLIPTPEHPDGFVVDQSFKTDDFVPSSNVPKEFIVSELVEGMITALPNMKEGDIWKVIIPYDLGYRNKDKDNTPAYSTLIFDIRLVRLP